MIELESSFTKKKDQIIDKYFTKKRWYSRYRYWVFNSYTQYGKYRYSIHRDLEIYDYHTYEYKRIIWEHFITDLKMALNMLTKEKAAIEEFKL